LRIGYFVVNCTMIQPCGSRHIRQETRLRRTPPTRRIYKPTTPPRRPRPLPGSGQSKWGPVPPVQARGATQAPRWPLFGPFFPAIFGRNLGSRRAETPEKRMGIYPRNARRPSPAASHGLSWTVRVCTTAVSARVGARVVVFGIDKAPIRCGAGLCGAPLVAPAHCRSGGIPRTNPQRIAPHQRAVFISPPPYAGPCPGRYKVSSLTT
jgi:hypothetical protein